jgi:hypothetical protein
MNWRNEIKKEQKKYRSRQTITEDIRLRALKATKTAIAYWAKVKVWNYSDVNYDIATMYTKEAIYLWARYKDCLTPGKSPFQQNQWPVNN